MTVRVLRLGNKGASVVRWQHFLIGRRHLRGRADGDFGDETERATRAYQRSKGITADGIAGPCTLGAALTNGFDIGFTGHANLTPGPTLTTPNDSMRRQLFGAFEFECAPNAENPEAITILGDWEAKNITAVTLPQLKGIPVCGEPSQAGQMRFHRKAANQLQKLWAAWASAGLIDRVLTCEGSYNPRLVRGQQGNKGQLSSHAYGSAFDINQEWNRLGCIPAYEGATGSVRELVGIANECGFFWGGHFKTRLDGMHFEVAKLVT